MLTTLPRADIRRAAAYTLGLTGLWILVAAWRPEVTYHLAPVLIAGIAPLSLTFDREHAVDRRSILLAGVLGLGISLLTTALLAGLGWLAGPSLLPTGGAAAEAVVFSIFGALIGTAVAWFRSVA